MVARSKCTPWELLAAVEDVEERDNEPRSGSSLASRRARCLGLRRVLTAGGVGVAEAEGGIAAACAGPGPGGSVDEEGMALLSVRVVV